MNTADFDYHLPPEYIAQTPIEPRDASRMLVVHRESGRLEHRVFREVGEYLRPGDLLVANDSRVIPARLLGRKTTGGQVEIFLLHPIPDSESRDTRPNADADRGQEPFESGRETWQCLVGGRGLKPGTTVYIEQQLLRPASSSPVDKISLRGPGQVVATIVAETPNGGRIVCFDPPTDAWLHEIGQVPLPPYIHEPLADPERYQTVYSRREGSVASSTAGLHFTPDLLVSLREQGVGLAFVTLHIGLDTFRPVKTEHVEDHPMHSEWASLSPPVARQINETTLAGGRVVAVGTTAVRTLEWAATGAQDLDPYDMDACPWRRAAAFEGDINLFIHPGYRFRAVDMMITNFHLPRSTLLMLVSAFAGKELMDHAYQEAIREGYRFYSFGDAMLIL